MEASRQEALRGLTGLKRQDVAVEQDVAPYLAIADFALNRHFEAEQRLNNLLRQHISAVSEAEVWFLMALIRSAAGQKSKVNEAWGKAAGLDLEIFVCRAAKEKITR